MGFLAYSETSQYNSFIAKLLCSRNVVTIAMQEIPQMLSLIPTDVHVTKRRNDENGNNLIIIQIK